MLSVIIIVRNEEHNLKRCLESIKWADEIIVLDSGSIDNSIAIAHAYTEKVYSTDWQGYGIQKQRALDYATQPWVLNLDADEAVDENLQAAIKKAIQSESMDAYRIPIHLNFYGKQLRFSWSPKRHIRLFKRLGARYSDRIVHEGVILHPKAKIGYIKYPIQHYSFRDVSHALYKMNHYTSYTASIRKQKNYTPSLMKIIFGTWWMFVRCYFLQGGILEGRAGFLLAVLNAGIS